jgi:hypothetical protein
MEAPQSALDAALGHVKRIAESEKRALAEQLNQGVRRLRQAADMAEWSATVLDITGRFCSKSTLVPAAEAKAAALASVIESGELVVAVRTRDEVSDRFAGPGRVYLFPIAKAFVLVAEEPVEPSALELLTSVAALARPQDKTLLAIAAAPAPVARPAWESLPKAEQEMHLRAQRFARVKVAEMLMAYPDAVAAGREGGRLYDTLQLPIDGARRQYESDFMSASATMVDYLHLELVRTLAQDDDMRLGEEYPGPLA